MMQFWHYKGVGQPQGKAWPWGKYRNNKYATIGSVEYSETPQKPTFSALQAGPVSKQKQKQTKLKSNGFNLKNLR